MIGCNSIEYQRIDISEGIDVNKTNLSKNVIFVTIGILNINHIFITDVNLMQKATGFNNIAIVYIKGSAYKIHFWHMSKDDAINIMTNSNLIVK